MNDNLPDLRPLESQGMPGDGARGLCGVRAGQELRVLSPAAQLPESPARGGEGSAKAAEAVGFVSRKVRPRKCPSCGNRFTPERTGQAVCSMNCAIVFAQAERAKQERKNDRARAEKLKSMRELLNEAQASFNAFIRARDAGKGCICCGKPFEEQQPGGAIDAGHFISRAAAPHLRFDENNCFAQRKNCNRPGGSTYAAFRAGVIERIGLAEVLRLEGPGTPRIWTREELIEIKAKYSAKRRALVKAQSNQ